MAFEIRPIHPADRDWLREVLTREWGGVTMVTRAKLYERVDLHVGLIAWRGDERIGVITYAVEKAEAEITLLHSFWKAVSDKLKARTL